MTITLGGMTPLSLLVLLPGTAQSWWRPCLTRAEGETGTHCWFLDATSSGTLYCHVCRVGRPRVYVGPGDRVEAIRNALDRGEVQLAQRLAFDNAPLPVVPGAVQLLRPDYRDRADWQEWWTERAAVYEFLGGVSRAEAEVAATELAGVWT